MSEKEVERLLEEEIDEAKVQEAIDRLLQEDKSTIRRILK